jgi:hypothetical protein
MDAPAFPGELLSPMLTEVYRPFEAAVGTMAAGAHAHPDLCVTTGIVACLALLGIRGPVAAIAILCQLASTLWLIGMLRQTDAVVAAVGMGWAGLLSSGWLGWQSIRRKTRFRRELQTLELEHLSTRRLLEREIEWREAAQDDRSSFDERPRGQGSRSVPA